jgi:hypothetical protein
MRLYRNMKSRISGVQKQKFYLYQGKSIINKQDFYNWAEIQPDFHCLFEAWQAAGWPRKMSPSVDRIDSGLGYEIGNMRWVTHSENSRNTSRNKSLQ